MLFWWNNLFRNFRQAKIDLVTRIKDYSLNLDLQYAIVIIFSPKYLFVIIVESY